MKYLFVIAHADPRGEASAYVLANAARDVLSEAGNEVRVVDLVKTPFLECASEKDFKHVPTDQKFSFGELQKGDNVVDCIKEQQELIKWCTHLVVFGPMWFFRFPAIFYNWVERVFTCGWAWDYPEGGKPPGSGKKCWFVITTGADSGYYSHGHGLTSLEGLLMPTTFGLSGVGFEMYRTQGIWDPKAMSKEEWESTIEKFKKAVLNLEHRPTFKYRTAPEGRDDVQVLAELPNIELDEAIAYH